MKNEVMTMASEKYSDSIFERIEWLECKKKWLNLFVWVGLIISPAIFCLDMLVFKMAYHQKGSANETTIILISIIAILCIILIAASFKKYFELRRLNRWLAELEAFEEIICQEVFSKSLQLDGERNHFR